LQWTLTYIAADIPSADAVFSTIAGILFGPLCANLINPYEWFNHDTHTLLNFTLHLSRIIIGIQVFFNGANLPKKYIKTEWLSLVMVLFPIMTFGWLLIGLLIWGIIPDLSYLEALVIAACIVPTDPVLANSICKGEQSIAGNPRGADEQVASPRHMYRLESEHYSSRSQEPTMGWRCHTLCWRYFSSDVPIQAMRGHR
jgi:NhaP-type Na+/H+ or K+/H+ antiporter